MRNKLNLVAYLPVCSCIDANGVTPILDTAWERGRIEFLNLSADPTVRHTVWTQVLITCDQDDVNCHVLSDVWRLFCLLLAVRGEPGPGPASALAALPQSRPGRTLDPGEQTNGDKMTPF